MFINFALLHILLLSVQITIFSNFTKLIGVLRVTNTEEVLCAKFVFIARYEREEIVYCLCNQLVARFPYNP